MADGWSQDVVTNVINVHWGSGVYVVIATEPACFAQLTEDSDESVRILETHTEDAAGATLIECSADAGANFVKLVTNVDADSDGGTMFVYFYILPQTEDALNNWKKAVFLFHSSTVDDAFFPVGVPSLWHSLVFQVGKPKTIPFKIQNVPHLIDPAPDQIDLMVQLYPMSGTTSWLPGFTELGWTCGGYRLDDAGVGTRYSCPVEWAADVVETVFGGPVNNGLLFGKDPPLISADTAI